MPHKVAAQFPELTHWLEAYDVRHVQPTSGFQAGVHQVNNWETIVANAIDMHRHLTRAPLMTDEIESIRAGLLQQGNDRPINRLGVQRTRRQLWEASIEGRPPIRLLD